MTKSVRIDRKVLQDTELSYSEKIVYALFKQLEKEADQDEKGKYIRISRTDIAELIDMSARNVTRLLVSLEDKGYIERIAISGKTPKIYVK